MSRVDEVRWIPLPTAGDDRGRLTSVEAERQAPFPIRRVFFVHHVTAPRGGHAHRDTDQLLIAVSGRLRVEVADGWARRSFALDDPSRGLYTPRMLFVRLVDFSPNAVCLVLANTYYDMSRSIRDWGEYLEAVAR